MGVEMLYSEEFLRAVRDHLTPGGVYGQWLHLYELEEETLDIVLRTFKEVFGDLAIWFTRGPDLLLVGFKDPSPEFDVARLRQRFERPDFRAGFERAEIDSWIQLLAHEAVPLGAVGATDLPGRLHTVRHPILSDSAARAFFAGGHVPLPRMASEAANRATERRSLLRLELGGKEPNEEILEELARHACAMARPQECSAVMARWMASHPDSPRLAEVARDLRPTNYLGADTDVVPSWIIEALAELHHGRPLEIRETPGLVNNAINTSRFYAAYFHHAFPFDRQALRRTWSACAADVQLVQSCAAERRKAEAELGPIFPRKESD
jgi:hypothetical protein